MPPAETSAPSQTEKEVPCLTQEVLNTILEHLDGDTAIFKRICLTNRHFYEWAKFSALKSWPVLRRQVRKAGKRICEGCSRILPDKQWVELAPRYLAFQTFCVTCRFRELGEIITRDGSFDEYVKHWYEDRPYLRYCPCCWHDFGTKRRREGQQKLGEKSAYCDHCNQLILGESLETQEHAKRWGVQYVDSVARFIAVSGEMLLSGLVSMDNEAVS